MAQKLETDIVLNLAGNLAAKARQYGNSMSDFAKRNERAMTLVRTSTAAASRGIDSLGNRYVGLATAFVTGNTIRNVANFEAQMTRIGTDAQLSSEQVDELTKAIETMANKSDIRIDTTNLASSVDVLLGKSGDLDFVMNNLENMGLFMQAFGVDAEATGMIFDQFREKGVQGSEEVLQLMDKLYAQFAIGSVSVKELAGVSSQLFSMYQGDGEAAILQMGALVQLFTKAKGNANEAVTSIQAVFSAFSDKKKVDFLNSKGIEVFKKGTNELREPIELLLEILESAQNNPMLLSDVFDSTATEGLASLYKEANKDTLKKMVADIKELGTTQEASAKNAATMNSAMVSLDNAYNKFANERLAEPIQELADAINSVDDKTIQNWMKWGEAAVWAIGGLVALKKGMSFASDLKNVLGTKGGNQGGAGGFQDLGAMPVFVVNMPGGGMGGLDTPVIDEKAQKGNKPTRSKFMSLSNLATATTVGYGLSIVPDFSPIDIRRASDVDRSQLPDGFPVSAGLMDVVDDFKRWFSSSSSNESIINNPYLSAQAGGNIKVDVSVSDDRITKKVSSSSPGITIDPDMGIN